MLTHRFVLQLLVVAALVISAVAPNACWAAQRGTARPIKGFAEGQIVGIVPPNQIIIDYVGIASHLGTFTRREFLFLNQDGTFQGTMVSIAANGDELHLTFVGQFISPTQATGTYTFTGGTGRFRDASGGAEFVATAEAAEISVVFEGTISY